MSGTDNHVAMQHVMVNREVRLAGPTIQGVY